MMKATFEKSYPFLHLYRCYHGAIELGADEHSDSWIRLLNEGGIRLSCDPPTLDESLQEAETWAKKWMCDYYEQRVQEAGLL